MEAKERRKRKDPESRDFACLCGKSYLSYAAAYTHAKNKHDGDKKYIEGIQKPAREQLKRGRPKVKKVSNQTSETARLTLIESTILKICELLEDNFPNSILEGNDERSQQDYEQHFSNLKMQHREKLAFVDWDNFEHEFISAIVKDFNVELASRVRFACIVLAQEHIAIDQILEELDRCDLWQGKTGINEVISSAYQQWRGRQDTPQIDKSNGDQQPDIEDLHS